MRFAQIPDVHFRLTTRVYMCRSRFFGRRPDTSKGRGRHFGSQSLNLSTLASISWGEGFHQVMAVLMDEAEYRGRLNAIEDQLSVLYKQRRQLTAEYAAAHPAVLPPATRRTAAQDRIARCPRCGLSEKDGAKI